MGSEWILDWLGGCVQWIRLAPGCCERGDETSDSGFTESVSSSKIKIRKVQQVLELQNPEEIAFAAEASLGDAGKMDAIDIVYEL
jgi:hypothetical protein